MSTENKIEMKLVLSILSNYYVLSALKSSSSSEVISGTIIQGTLLLRSHI